MSITRHSLCMARLKKKQVKEDKLVTTVEKMSIFLTEHWKKLVIAGIGIVAIVGIIIGVYTYTVSKNDKAVSIINEGTTLFEEAETAMSKDGDKPSTISKYDTAKAKFQEAIQSGGSKNIISKALLYSAICSYKAKKYNEAITDYEKILKKYSKGEYVVLAKDGIAKSYEQIGDEASLRKAIQYYDELSKYPESYLTVSAILSKGRCYEKLGDKDQALSAYKTVVDKFKQKIESAVQTKSKSVVELAKTAISKYQSALGNDSDANFKTLLENARSLEKGKQDQWFSVLLAYDKAILAREEYWQNQSSTASSKKIKEAEKALIEYQNQSADLIKNISTAKRYESSGDWDSALQYYIRALDFDFLPTRNMYEEAQDRIDHINLVNAK
ncbi:TPA: tetratricopeptide repeat protein [Candidatus Poribacteria bacterium]|nr:tetratricopeptide repeat protein [Candidatus Poribacteria bacterium]